MARSSRKSRCGGAKKKTPKQQQQQQQKKKEQQQQQQSKEASEEAAAAKEAKEANFVSSAGPGCYIARPNYSSNNNGDDGNNNLPWWMLGWETVHPDDFVQDDEDDDEDNNKEKIMSVPDIALDPEEHILTVTNLSLDETKVAYVTVYETLVRGRRSSGNNKTKLLPLGSTTDKNGNTRQCVTFIVLVPPCQFAHLVYLEAPLDSSSSEEEEEEEGAAAMTSQNHQSSPSSSLVLENVEIDSDIQTWNKHPCLNDTHPHTLGFPLQFVSSFPSDGNNKDRDNDNDNNNNNNNNNSNEEQQQQQQEQCGFLCTQGESGALTHFFSGNLHAIDFRCSIGTPLLAVGDGVVTQVHDSNALPTGIAVSNLFTWNSIMLKLDVEDDDDDDDDDDDVGNNSCNHSGPPPPPQQQQQYDDDNAAAAAVVSGGPLFVEYVHIQQHSALVKVGDRVTKGQLIGASGSIGFSPEPHLHLAAYRSEDATAPTVRVFLEGRITTPKRKEKGIQNSDQDDDASNKNKDDDDDDEEEEETFSYLPRAGLYYNRYGPIASQTHNNRTNSSKS